MEIAKERLIDERIYLEAKIAKLVKYADDKSIMDKEGRKVLLFFVRLYI